MPSPGLPTGRIVNLNTGIIDERAGLGDVATRWPDLRIWTEGVTVTLEADATRAVVPFKIPWTRHYLLCAELVGWPYWDASNTFKRMLPESFRNWEWVLDPLPNSVPKPVIYCTKILSVKGIGGNIPEGFAGQNSQRTGAIYYPDPQYEWARVEALFETLTYDVKLLSQISESADRPRELQRFVIKTEDSGGRFITFDWGQWVLMDGANIREANTRSVNYWESFNTVTYTWLDVLPEAFNFLNARKLQGKSNNAIFDGYQPETLMLQKVDRKPRKTQLGIRTYEVTIQFLEVPTGVNKARPPGPTSTPEYWDVRRKGATTERPFPPADMSVIFKP